MIYEYTLPDNTKLKEGTAFKLDGISYPRNWLINATDQDLTDRSITKAEWTPPPKPDPVSTVLQVKAEARRRIIKIYDEDKQRNYIAREGELGRIESGTMRDDAGNLVAGRLLTAGEIAELVFIRGVWEWIKSVRAASNAIEIDPPKKSELKTDNRWPADPA